MVLSGMLYTFLGASSAFYYAFMLFVHSILCKTHVAFYMAKSKRFLGFAWHCAFCRTVFCIVFRCFRRVRMRGAGNKIRFIRHLE